MRKNEARFILWMALLLICSLLALAGAAKANGPYRSYGYTYQSYPQYSGWTWGKYPSNHSYFVRWRWVTRNYGNRTWETDGRLYTRDASGNYAYWKDIADYHPKGDARYGIEDVRKAIAKVDKQVGALIDLKHDAPNALNPRDLLPLYKDTRDAELASEERKWSMVVESNRAATLKRLDNDAAERSARLALAEKEAFANTVERHIAQLAESWQAAGGTKAVLDQAQLAIDDPELERDIRVSCLGCHGGANDKGTAVNFKNIESIDWTDVLTTVATGEMPKGGEPWDAQQLGRLKEYAKKQAGK